MAALAAGLVGLWDGLLFGGAPPLAGLRDGMFWFATLYSALYAALYSAVKSDMGDGAPGRRGRMTGPSGDAGNLVLVLALAGGLVAGALAWPLGAVSLLNLIAPAGAKWNQRPMEYGWTLYLSGATGAVIGLLTAETAIARASGRESWYGGCLRASRAWAVLFAAAIVLFDALVAWTNRGVLVADGGLAYLLTYVALLQLPPLLWLVWISWLLLNLRRSKDC